MNKCFLCSTEVHNITLCDKCNLYIYMNTKKKKHYNKVVDEIINDLRDDLYKENIDHEITETRDHITIKLYF